MLFVHVLCVAGINNGNRVALDGVGVIPLIGVRHVVARPSADSGTAAWQCSLNGIDSKKGITNIALHILIRIGMAVLFAHVLVEGSNLGSCTFGVEILILHLSRRR